MKGQPKVSRYVEDSSNRKKKNQERWIEQFTMQEIKLTEGGKEKINVIGNLKEIQEVKEEIDFGQEIRRL